MEPFLVILGLVAFAFALLIPIALLYLAYLLPPLNRRVRKLEAEVVELQLMVQGQKQVEPQRTRPVVLDSPPAIAPRRTVPLNALQEPGDVPSAAQEPGDVSSVAAQEPGDLPSVAQEPGDVSSAAQEPGDLSSAAQEPGDLPSAAQEPGDVPSVAQEPGDVPSVAAQEPGDLSQEPGEPEIAQEPPRQQAPPRRAPSGPPKPSPWALIQDNIITVIGILVVFIGVAALIQYGADAGWFTFPIEFRLAGIAAVGVAGLAFGWLQRTKRRAFGLTLQGGGIGILLMTVFSAFKFYDLLPPTPALAIALVLVASAGALAVLQNSSALVVLALLAGFASPLLISSGSGNYIALFSYYAVLNVVVMAVAWFKPWRWLNLLGFFFTFGIGLFWGVFQYSDDKLWTTLPFVVIYYVLYLLIPVFNARKAKGGTPGAIDGILVFGNPLFSYLALSLLFQEQLPLAFAALGLAVVNAGLAGALIRFTEAKTLGRYHAAIALTFATLAVPLAFSASTTAGIFAIEGLVMGWLGLRDKNFWLQAVGPILFLLAGLLDTTIINPADAPAILNPAFMSRLLISLSGFAAAFLYHREKHGAAVVFYVWGLIWWMALLAAEVEAFVPFGYKIDASVALAALTIALLGLVHHFMSATALRWTMALGFVIVFLCGMFKVDAAAHVFADYGFYAWIAYGILGGLGLFTLRDRDGLDVGLGHSAWLFGWVFAISSWLSSTADTQGLAQAWVAAAAVLPSLALVTSLLFVPKIVGFPMKNFDSWRPATTLTSQIFVFLLWIFMLVQNGDAGATWLPIINPVDLSLLGILGLFAVWLRSELVSKNSGSSYLSILFLFFVTISDITLRSVHHFTDAPWSIDIWDSAAAQMSLTIVWSLFGMANWIIGSKRGNRGVWKVGVFFIFIVLAKLGLVDREHLSGLMGIGSFLGYGVLCLIVGFLAPAPPSKTKQVPTPENDEVQS